MQVYGRAGILARGSRDKNTTLEISFARRNFEGGILFEGASVPSSSEDRSNTASPSASRTCVVGHKIIIQTCCHYLIWGISLNLTKIPLYLSCIHSSSAFITMCYRKNLGFLCWTLRGNGGHTIRLVSAHFKDLGLIFSLLSFS